MTLCDIGNTTADIYKNGICKKVNLVEFQPELLEDEVWYASVNHRVSETLTSLQNWHDCTSLINWDKYYPTIGIDRILVCEAINDGIIVDAGSAITVDSMHQGVYQGGFISLGLRAAQEAYTRISPALSMSFNFEVDLTIMAKNTPDAITLGFLGPLIQTIKSYGRPIYVTGGDAHIFSSLLKEAIVDDTLIFKGMEKLIDKGLQC